MAQAPTTWILTGSPQTVAGPVRSAGARPTVPDADLEPLPDRVRAAAGVPA